MTINDKKDPLISIIIPVYNSEKTLVRCLDSIAFQTSRNFEVLIIDKESTDNSKQIERIYAEKYPDVFRLIDRPYSNSSAAAMRYGIEISKGAYITRGDPDDWYQLDAVETMEKAIFNNATDFILFNAKGITNNPNNYSTKIISVSKPISIPNLIMNREMMAYWNKLFRRELTSLMEPISEDMYNEDWFYLCTLATHAKSVSFVDKIIYNYVIGVGESWKTTNERSFLQSYEYILRNANMEKYANEVFFGIITRITLAFTKFYRYRSEIHNWAIKYRDELENNKYLTVNDIYYKRLLSIFNYVPVIPLIIYLESNCQNEQNNDLKFKAFNNGLGRIEVLSGNFPQGTPQFIVEAWESDNYHKTAIEYLALRAIYETGGFFVGSRVRLITPINCLCDNKSFFSFDSNDSFTDQIYGAMPHSNVVWELLSTYENPEFYNDKYCSLCDRIKNILCAVYDVPLDGKKHTMDEVTVFDPSTCVINFNDGFRVCWLDYLDLAENNEYVVIKRSNLFNPASFPANITAIKNQAYGLKRELNEIKNSDSYKLVKHLKKFGNTKVGGFFKKIFKWFLKKYRHVKYGM